FFNYLAYAFGGAFVVEIVFSINGIGKLMADSVLANDLMVIAAIILYLIFIKMVLTLLSDVVNYWLNPSIKF
ncbi:MAG: ABC-type dipeptide/oligopeptide/nickel transport system permease component, partial [Cyclobacteriaceae bacterium]